MAVAGEVICLMMVVREVTCLRGGERVFTCSTVEVVVMESGDDSYGW